MEIFKKEVLSTLSNMSTLNVAVHNGIFHSDDVISVSILRLLAKECGFTLNIIRTRDESELNKADMRVDVGKRYDENTWDFDHHQNDPSLIQPEGVMHAAVGLLCKWCMAPEFLKLFRKKYLLGIEHQDNTGKIHPQYASIGFSVQPFLPAYGEDADINSLFNEAVEAMTPIVQRAIKTTAGFLKAEEEFSETVEEKLAGGKIVVMKKWLPIEEASHPDLAFTIAPALNGGYSLVGKNGHLLKEELRGLNSAQIAEITGYEGVFTHKNGFTATLKTLEGAKALCLQSL